MNSRRPTYRLLHLVKILHNISIISDVTLSKQGRVININKHHFSQFSPCLSLKNARFRKPWKKALPTLFYTRKHSSCSCESLTFTNSVRVSSDHDAETRASSLLFRHSYVRCRTWTIPDFRMSAKTACLFSLIFYLSSISVIEIGFD